jgi:hypothetical protein
LEPTKKSRRQTALPFGATAQQQQVASVVFKSIKAAGGGTSLFYSNMVTINEDAFAAVNAAFPDALITEPSSSERTVEMMGGTSSFSRKRQGVGVQKSPRGEKADIEKMVLQIGRKKRKQLAEDEDDFDGLVIDKDSQVEEDVEDEEDDLGRTSIVAGTKKSPVLPSIEETIPRKKRKKKNKKRKGGQNETSISNDNSRDKDHSNGKPAETEPQKPSGSETANETAGTGNQEILCGADAIIEDPQNQLEQGEAKNLRKRKKKRSRQKNIRKDNRLQKPEHLNPISKDYKGRPLTAETRRRLNMSESRNVQKLKAYWSKEHGSSATI